MYFIYSEFCDISEQPFWQISSKWNFVFYLKKSNRYFAKA